MIVFHDLNESLQGHRGLDAILQQIQFSQRGVYFKGLWAWLGSNVNNDNVVWKVKKCQWGIISDGPCHWFGTCSTKTISWQIQLRQRSTDS